MGTSKVHAVADGPVPCLDVALSAYLDFWYGVSLLNTARRKQMAPPICSEVRAAANAMRFRKYLLRIQHDALRRELPVSPSEFHFPDDFPAGGRQFAGGLAPPLTAWSLFSRRIYEPTREVVALLRHTSLNRICWSDLNPPFPSYAIALPEPIRDESGWGFDFLTVSRFTSPDDHLPRWEIRSFGSSRVGYRPIDQKQQTVLRRFAERGNWSALAAGATAIIAATAAVSGSYFVLQPAHAEEPVLETVARLVREQQAMGQTRPGAEEMWEAMVRIVLGLSIYTLTLEPHERQPESRKYAGLGKGSISRRAEVGPVISNLVLSAEERIWLGLDGTHADRQALLREYEILDAYWRRWPGTGDDAEAPRNVHVRWHIRTRAIPRSAPV